MRPGFLIAESWNGLNGLLRRKMLRVDFVNVTLAYQKLLRRHYIATLLEVNIIIL